MRENPGLQKYILLHTSLDGGATKEAAKKVGANGYVIKNDIDKIIEYLEDFLRAERCCRKLAIEQIPSVCDFSDSNSSLFLFY